MVPSRRRRNVSIGLALLFSMSLFPTSVLAVWPPTKQQALEAPIIPFPGAVTFRVFATREGLVGGTTANGHVIKPRDRFVALPSRTALSSKDGREKQVLVSYKGRQAVAPVWDVGPWNIRDNYWDAADQRATGQGLARGWPAAAAQYFDRANGGISDKGYTVRNPAGIDLADGLFWDDLKMTDSDWVDVTFLWLSPGAAYVMQPIDRSALATVPAFTDTPSKRYFAATGHSLSGVFKTVWESRGGLAQFGLPLTEPFAETSIDDGRTYTVQYFERVRLEYHPEKAGTEYEVLLGFLGKAFHAVDPPAAALPGARYFPETGHNLSGDFRAYWERNGGLAVNGYPITEEISEVNAIDGKTYTVQYFERARFERHPENKPPYNVLLGQLGRQLLDLRTGR